MIDYQPVLAVTGGATPIAARESVVRYQMALREGAYTDLKQFRVFLGTYNVNGQAPTSGLADWLAVDMEPPDIYSVGFQELDLSKEAFLFNETPREDEWLRAVIRGLHPKAKYRKVKLIRLVGMMLIVFIQEKHFAYVRGVAAETVGTGLMGKLGNKVMLSCVFHCCVTILTSAWTFPAGWSGCSTGTSQLNALFCQFSFGCPRGRGGTS